MELWKGTNWNKLLSGRWLLTIMVGLTFCFMSFSGLLDAVFVQSIIVMVFTLYFSRNRDNEEGEKK